MTTAVQQLNTDLFGQSPVPGDPIALQHLAATVDANNIKNGGTINVTPTTNPLVVNGNTIGLSSYRPNTLLELIGGGANAAITIDTFTGAAVFTGRRADGSINAPSAIGLGENINVFNAVGYGATGYGSFAAAELALVAAEGWSDTAQGTYMGFSVTATGSTVRAEAMRLQASGILTLGTLVANGTAKLQVSGGALIDTVNVGAAAGVPTITSGAGAPSSTQPNGSLYLRTDGAANTRVYISEGGGTWAAISSA